MAALSPMFPSPAQSAGRIERSSVRQLQEQVAVFDFDGKRSGAAGIRRFGAAVFEADGPAVQRAGDAASEHDSLRQGPPLVRAAIEQGEALAFGVAEQGDVAARTADDAGAELGDVLEPAGLDPARRAHRFARFRQRFRHQAGSASAWYSSRSLPAARSFQGSGSPSSATFSLAHSALRLSSSSTTFFLMVSRPTRRTWCTV